MACDFRLVSCPACDGEGSFEVFTGRRFMDGDHESHTTGCGNCDGTGRVLQNVEPVTIEDLDQ